VGRGGRGQAGWGRKGGGGECPTMGHFAIYFDIKGLGFLGKEILTGWGV
jgi:hypothetical protein